MPSLNDIVNQYAKPVDVSGISQSSMQGAQLGMDIVQRQQQMQMFQQEQSFRRQQLEQQKQEHMTGLMDKISTTQDPTIRGQLLEQAQQVGNKLGYPVSDHFIEAFKKSEDLRKSWLQNTAKRNLMDPSERVKAVADSAGTMMGGPEQIAGFLDKVSSDQSKLMQSQILAGGKVDAVAVGKQMDQQNTLRKNRQTALTDPNDIKALSGMMGANAQAQAEAKADSVLGTRAQRASDDKSQNLQSEVQNRKAMQGIAQQRVNNTAQSMAMRGQQLDLNKTKLLNTVETRIEQSPDVRQAQQSVQFADQALDRLKPNMHWIDMYDVAADFNRLITGNVRASFQGEDRRTFTSLQSTLDNWKGKAENGEQGGPSMQEIGIFRDRVNAMKDSLLKYHDNVYLRRWQGKVATGVVSEDLARAHFEANKLSDNSTWDKKAPQAITTAQTPISKTGQPGASVDPILEKQRAMNAISQIKSNPGPYKVSEDDIRRAYEQKTGQKADF